MTLYPWILLHAALAVLDGQQCFEDAVAAGKRRNLSDTESGESFPFAMWVPTWASGTLTSAVVGILVEEKLGYNLRTSGGPGTPDQYYAMAGCETPHNITSRGCGDGPKKNTFHASLDGWTWTYTPIWNSIQETYPSTAPLVLGGMGYSGRTGQFVPSRVLDRAYLEKGIALDYYRGFDASWQDAREYFDPATAINLSLLMPCEDSRLSEVEPMQRYVNITGDFDGVVMQGSEVLHGRCFFGRMWLPPMCRQNASLCFLHVTPGLGYELEHFMQRATSFFIPMGIAVAKDWAAYTVIPDQTTGSFFWWTPDPTFLHFTSRQVIYPLLDTRAYARGDFRTGGEPKQIEKYVSQDLKKLSENIWNLIRSFSIDSNALEELMLDEKQTSDLPRDVACRWLQNHDEWHGWLPGPAECPNQFGLYNRETSQYVLSRTNEALTSLTCLACQPGHKSTQLIDTLGKTRVCEPCSIGTAQKNGAAEKCDPCPAGEYEDETGSSACKRCNVSTYQNLTGQDACQACPVDRTTLGEGSDRFEDCVCKSGMIEENRTRTCVACDNELEGLVCPKGSTVDKLLEGVDDGPYLLESYSSSKSDPLVIYKCSKDVCPGGKPGQCNDGRIGPTCGHCPSGKYLSYFGMCTDCGAGNAGLWFGMTVLAMGAFAYAFYYALTRGYKARGDAAVVAGCGVGMALNLIQNVMVISAAPTVWPTMMIFLVDRFHLLTLNLEVSHGTSFVYQTWHGAGTGQQALSASFTRSHFQP